MANFRLLTELAESLLTEGGDFLSSEWLGADLIASPAVQADLTTEIDAFASVMAVSNVTSAGLSTEITLSASVASTASVSATITTEITALSALISISNVVSSEITATITPASDLLAEATATADVQTAILMAGDLSATPSLAAPLSTSINLISATSVAQSVSADVETSIKLGSSISADSSFGGFLSTSIDAFSALMAVSNVADAQMTTGINMAAQIEPLDGLMLVEDGFSLLLEDGGSLRTEADSAYLQGLMGFIIDVDSSLYCESAVTGDLATQIVLSSAVSAIAEAAAALSTEVRLELTVNALSETVAAVTTSIQMVGPISTQSSVSPGLTTSILAAATLNANPVFAAEIKTSINALTALIGISNISDAALTVYRVDPQYQRLDSTIYIAELQAYDPSTSSVVTWRFSTGTGFDNGGQFYAPRIEQPATLSRSMGGSSAGGRTSQSYGELTLVNNDGGINALGDDFFDGRTLILKRGNPDLPYSTFATVLVATVESVAMERERISVRLRDKAVTLDTPFSSSKYAGTNVLPNGIEGTADDLKGQPKPRIFGRIALMSPKLVNTSKLIYQVNDGAVDAVVNVFDAGAYLTKVATDYTSQADMEANAPQAGTWRAWPDGGCFRLGSSPFGQVSACVVEKWAYNQSNASGILQRILTEKGYTSSDWVASDFTTLSQKNAGTLGVIVNDEETTASLLDRVCQSVGAWWGYDSLGRFRVARLDAPAGIPITTLTDSEILELERQPEDKLPIWQTTMKADVNYVVQEKSALAGVVADNRVAWFNTESRDQKVSDANVKAVRLLAEDESYDSLLNGISQAQAESNRRLSLFSVRRDTVTVTLANPYDHYSSLDLGAVVSLQTAKLGYTSGKLFTVTGVNIDYQANTIDLTLWG